MALDSLVGLVMLLVATIVFAYYSLWTFVVPFLDEDSSVAQLFPPREWIIRIPAILLVLGTAAVGTFVGSVMMKKEKKSAAKNSVKKTQ
ncbi:hypothetical protein DASB73_021730 [Starmerella bacillaris]|uniref:Dolichol phosphate-mannose biosynthesis regulatory protein n=1 Tax=Starmerella bacillaris TaxID=1247836 RepID=A0AAV5RIF1_STABA|nr:hypothetical protein DASB73_021730 [Starmerella bacillaris]